MHLDKQSQSLHIQGTVEGLDPLKYRWASQANTDVLVKRRGPIAEAAEILSEFKMVQKLEHKNILQLVDHFADDQNIFICSPIMNLGSAKRLLNSFYNNGFPEPTIVFILQNVLSACQYLHTKHIIHRGLRAKNILLDSNGSVKLTGFQNALFISDCNRWIGVENRVHDFSQSLSPFFVWLAPEVMKQDLCGYGIASDVYSIGITLCELGNGFAPFQEMEPMQILYEKLRGSTPYLLDSSTGFAEKCIFSLALHDITAKCLCYDDIQRCSCEILLKHSIFKEQLGKTLSELLHKVTSQKLLLNKSVPSA